jgi:hypothetical protein
MWRPLYDYLIITKRMRWLDLVARKENRLTPKVPVYQQQQKKKGHRTTIHCTSKNSMSLVNTAGSAELLKHACQYFLVLIMLESQVRYFIT